MFGLGVGELVIILVIILIMFGAGRLPELGTSLGEGIKNFKKGYRDSKSIDVTPEEQNRSDEQNPASAQNGPQGSASSGNGNQSGSGKK